MKYVLRPYSKKKASSEKVKKKREQHTHKGISHMHLATLLAAFDLINIRCRYLAFSFKEITKLFHEINLVNEG
jgi:hypothetical protein